MGARKGRLLVPLSAAATLAVAAGAIALAQDSDQTEPAEPAAGSRAEPQLIPFEEQETFRAGAPDHPYIDFCPTPEQIEAFAERHGVDLEPNPPGRRACSSEGALTPPDPPYRDPAWETMTDRERCIYEEEAFLSARPLPPKPGDDPGTFRGQLPDGREVLAFVDGDPEHLEKTVDDINDLGRPEACR